MVGNAGAGPAGPTIRSVAIAAGVSVSTVSRVVRGHADVQENTRKHVLDVIKALNYRPSPIARALVSGRSPTLGFLVSDIANPFYPQLAKSVEREARKCGYAVVICNTDDDPTETLQYIEMLRDLGAAGIIQASGGPDDGAVVDAAGGCRRVTFTNRRPTAKACNYVVSDNELGAVTLTEHLVSLGHRRIGFVTGPEFATNARDRLEGFRKVMGRLGLDGEALVSEGTFDVTSGRRAVQSWLEAGELPTAIIGVNDQVAVGVLEALHSARLTVPNQVAVAGFDDVELADSSLLGLTSVRQHIDRMGREAVQIALQTMSGESTGGPIQRVIAPELAIRQTTNWDVRVQRPARDSIAFSEAL
jgi:DNA-binding LacI/PurR family transcriptional regulator